MRANQSTFKTTAAGIGVAIIFGFSFLFTKNALRSLPPFDLIGLRFALAAIVMTLLALFGLIRINLRGGRWLWLLPLSAFQPVAYFLCETYGIKLTSASEAGMIIGSSPVVVALLAAAFLGERPRPLQLVGILFSSLGVAVMVAGSGGGASHLGGLLLLIGAVLSAAFYNILSRHLSSEFGPMEMTFFMMWTGAVVFNGMALTGHWMRGSFAVYRSLILFSTWIPLLYLGIISSVAAFFLMNYMLGRIEAYRTAAFINLTTLVSVLAGLLILGERIRFFQIAGGIMILFGVWGANHFARSGQAGNTNGFEQA